MTPYGDCCGLLYTSWKCVTSGCRCSRAQACHDLNHGNNKRVPGRAATLELDCQTFLGPGSHVTEPHGEEHVQQYRVHAAIKKCPDCGLGHDA
jgi:hypothetical protein